MKKFFKEFKTFITRGNVLDMAVGVIVGSAFTAIVTALSNNILKPIINWIIALCIGENSLESVYTFLGNPVKDPLTGAIDLSKSIYIDWGSFINAIINFILVAFVLFLIVKLINKIKAAGDHDKIMKEIVQRKFDRNENLTRTEQAWLEKMKKKDPANAPKTAEELAAEAAASVPAEPVVPELSSTDKLLTEILEQLKANKQ